MLAVIASVVFLLYVLVPGAIFRMVTSMTLPLKKFHKTKTQEVTFAVISCALPFWLAVGMVWYVAVWPFPTRETLQQRKQAYRALFLAMDSDKELDRQLANGSGLFWQSANSVLKRQGRFLFWYYFLVGVESLIVSYLARRYKKSGKRRLKDGLWAWLVQRSRDQIGTWVLPPIISEWHVLLTNFGSPGPTRVIELDVLSIDGILYKGRLRDYFFSVEGELAGILLSQASRFDREDYLEHKKADLQAALEKKHPVTPELGFTGNPKNYWHQIPGADLFYIPKERIANINVRHVTPESEIPQAASIRLADRKITDLRIEKTHFTSK
jgi:hypothetical protein